MNTGQRSDRFPTREITMPTMDEQRAFFLASLEYGVNPLVNFNSKED